MIETNTLALLILPMTLMLLASAFGLLWSEERSRLSSLFFCVAFAGIGVSFSFIVLSPQLLHTPWVLLVWAPTLISLSCALLGISLNQRSSMSSGLRATYVLLGVTALCFGSFGFTPTALITAGELSCLVLYVWGLYLSWTGRKRTADRILGGFMIAGVTAFSCRIVLFLNGFLKDISAEALLQSDYLLTLQFFSSFIIIGSGLALMAGEVQDKFSSQRAIDLTDPLSGLMNRKGFLEKMRHTVESAMRDDKPVSIIVADIDKFKGVNDRFGHDAGDQVISAFGELLREFSRGSDLASRMGGEEFLLLLSGASPEAALRIAHRMREDFAAIRLPLTNCEQQTASFGIATLRDPGDFDAACKRADEALYKSKRGGRNRVCTEDGDVSPPPEKIKLVA